MIRTFLLGLVSGFLLAMFLMPADEDEPTEHRSTTLATYRFPEPDLAVSWPTHHARRRV